MLKNKKITYLLIILVMLIWGLVFYKIYSKFGGSKRIVKSLPKSVGSIESSPGDSIFTLVLDYPDPFLKAGGQASDLHSQTAANTPQKPAIVWPAIEYRGYVVLSNKKERTGLLKIQNSDLLVKQGKEYFGVKIRTITKDSIFVAYKMQGRWLPILKK